MSCIWVSARECRTNELFQLTELVRKDRDLQIIVSCEPPVWNKERERTEQNASDLLVKLGVRANLKGYQYLKTAVKLCRKDREELDGITKRLYPSIAKEQRTTADKVEHAIRHAITASWEKGRREEQRTVFGYDADSGRRPTNSEFILQILDYLEKMDRPLYS